MEKSALQAPPKASYIIIRLRARQTHLSIGNPAGDIDVYNRGTDYP